MNAVAIVFGAATLAILDAVVSRQAAASNVSSWLKGTGNFLDRFLSPAVPAFSASTTSTTAATSTTTTAPPNAVLVPPALAPTGTRTL